MGNILLVERRVLQYRLVLTCERGLVEIDVSHLPDLVIETARVPMRSGFGVVGRIDGGAFAVTAGHDRAVGPDEHEPRDARRLADREPARSAEDAARDAVRLETPEPD